MTTEKNKKTISGVVVSDKMDQTVIVRVDKYVKHPKYQKFLKKSKRYAVHNPENVKKVGDKVEIIETKPISKTKKFIIAK